MNTNILTFTEDLCKNIAKVYDHEKLKAEDCSNDELLYATDKDMEERESSDWKKEQQYDWDRDRR